MNDIEILLDGLDETNINSILLKWKEINMMKKKMEDVEEMLKSKVKIFLKERYWTTYLDDSSKITVTLSTETRETFDKKALKFILSDSQLAQVTKIEQHEKLLILTPESRDRIKAYIRK